MGESFQDYSWIQNFEADFILKVSLKCRIQQIVIVSLLKKNVNSLYRVCTEMGEQNSRTIPGLFSFFKDSISSQFVLNNAKNALFSAENIEVKRLVFFDPDSGDKKRDYRTNWIE